MRVFLQCIPLLAVAATPVALAQSKPGAGLVASAGPTTVVAKLYGADTQRMADKGPKGTT
ncbi:hypothetical protein BJI69_19610 [Luteibacter rhizovicinus DSM 16549]|uniref:Uncharacterized protein n=1 Tax=Luteibacter rhizovicinus DSM 16549 TaxID=1440763 RepID=A0A0G9HDA9_9GAMM|nr:hypothetical protein [Luteibacter rhizovicinus]APG05893.1 hypothetical protein BJI69_19610 [Luteibacter rhizovicinus DSM 16549]KLD67159.1 hypothetical protein Y883_09390 [Luteibacter rhizovicinus DSM 16549]KLD73419.1 hypothetical protein Y886_38125 [Xanthomonas hyacinthi DSM 19077]